MTDKISTTPLKPLSVGVGALVGSSTFPDKQRVTAEMNRQWTVNLLALFTRPCPRCGAVEGDSCERPCGEAYGRHYQHRARANGIETKE